MPALRSRVKENRVRIPGDPVTVNGERFCQYAIVRLHEEIQEGSYEPSFCVGFSPEYRTTGIGRRRMAEAGAGDFGTISYYEEEAT